MYDLNLIPIHIHQGQPLEKPVGFYASKPPRRAARSRSEDMLILSLSTWGNDRITPEITGNWVNRLSQVFYKTSGSVTSALRTLIETLNLTMMERNLKSAQDGGAITGAVNLVAVHRRSLYIAQSGLNHAFTLTHQGLQHFADSSRSDRGLGLSRTPSIRYYQADLGTGGYLFMVETPPGTWTEDLLLSGGFPSLEQLRRRLLNQAPVNFRLDLVQIIPGEGQINTIQSAQEPKKISGITPTEAQPVVLTSEPVADPALAETSDNEGVQDTQQIGVPTELSQADDMLQKGQIAPEPEQEDEVDEAEHDRIYAEPQIPQPAEEGVQAHRFQTGSPATPIKNPRQSRQDKESGKAAREKLIQQSKKIRQECLQSLAAIFDWWHRTSTAIRNFFKNFLARLTQGDGHSELTLSRGRLLFIALVVPLIVVAIAVGVYLARGRTLQYQYYFEKAQAASSSALTAEDPAVIRSQWAQSLLFLDQAEDFRMTNETAALREAAQDALDQLDGAVRLAYRPAISGTLHSDINITNIVSYGLDLYLLDAAGGRVIHATQGSQGYEVDPEFVCGAGNFGSGGVDHLVDMVSLPINNPYQAHILAVDTSGNAVYCAPGQDPVVQSLPVPGGVEGGIKDIAYDNNSLYVLDSSSNSVQVYASTEGQFLDPPVNYFEDAKSDEIPDMTTAVDIAVNGRELYLLRSNGKLIDCVYSGLPGNPVTCEAPVQYIDGRLGLEDQSVVMPDASYVAVMYSAPPDPAVSILDATNADIYRFSLRFRLHQRLRANLDDYEIESPTATAFTIGIDRIAFLAFGNQVFYAYVQ